MKTLLSIAVCAALGLSLSADPVTALLVVQNHSSVKDAAVLSSMGDQFASALGSDVFEIINPNDVIGEGQNVGPWGEKMPVSSAVRLAESCDAEFLITAAITDCSRKDIGSPAKASSFVVSWTVAAKRVPGGGTVCSVTVPYQGRKHAAQVFSDSFSNVRDEALRESVSSAARQFLTKADGKVFEPKASAKVFVAFLSNVAGADVKIDGISFGIAGTSVEAPLRVEVSKGLHNLEVSYPYMMPYKTTAKFTSDSTFAVNLHETVAGRELRMSDTAFALMMDRVAKGGATDDEVKLIKAKGYAAFLEASSVKVEGMPERLTLVNGQPDAFGLGVFQVEGDDK